MAGTASLGVANRDGDFVSAPNRWRTHFSTAASTDFLKRYLKETSEKRRVASNYSSGVSVALTVTFLTCVAAKSGSSVASGIVCVPSITSNTEGNVRGHSWLKVTDQQ